MIRPANFTESPYRIYSKEYSVSESVTCPADAYYVSPEELETHIFNSAEQAVRRFASSADNKNIYACALFIDENGYHGISFASESDYAQKEDPDAVKEWGLYAAKYNEGDFGFRYFDTEFFTEELAEITGAFYSIGNDHPIAEVSKDIAFSAKLFDSMLVPIGISVLNRLKETLALLDQTEDFIRQVKVHDSSNETNCELLTASNDEERVRKLFPNLFE